MQSQNISNDLLGLGPLYRAQLDQSEHLGQWKKDEKYGGGGVGRFMVWSPEYLLNYNTRQSELFKEHVDIKMNKVKGGQKGIYHYV